MAQNRERLEIGQHRFTEESGGSKVEVIGGEEGYSDRASLVKGVYAQYPGATPRFDPSMGRETLGAELSVARIYLTNLTPGESQKSRDLGYPGSIGKLELFKHGYVGFLLHQVTEQHEEKAQVVPLNGDNYASYFMGQRPTVYRFSGTLLNTEQDPWRTVFSELYQYVMRGSRVAASRRMVQIAYDGKIVTGAMMDLQQSLDAVYETKGSFSFQFLVKHVLHFDRPKGGKFGWYNKAYEGTFLGNTKGFDEVKVPDAVEEASLIKTAFIAPPPRPRPSSGASKCKVKHKTQRDSGGGATASANQAKVAQTAAGCGVSRSVKKAADVLDKCLTAGKKSKDQCRQEAEASVTLNAKGKKDKAAQNVKDLRKVANAKRQVDQENARATANMFQGTAVGNYVTQAAVGQFDSKYGKGSAASAGVAPVPGPLARDPRGRLVPPEHFDDAI